jgi:hypothetical protein
MKPNARIKGFLVLILIMLLPYLAWNSYPVQDFVGRFMGTDSKRSEHVYQSLKDEKDNKLIKLLSHGDLAKASGAAQVLADRGNSALYEKVFRKMQSEKHKFNRDIMEHLLGSLDLEKGTRYYYEQLKLYNEKNRKYWTYIHYLTAHRSQGIFDFLIEKAKEPNAWNTNIGYYLAMYGDPRAVPVLQDLKSKIPADGSKNAWYATREINRAIKKLEEVQSSNQST